MIKIKSKRLIFDVLEVWFSNSLFDVDGYGHVMFRNCIPQKNRLGFKCERGLTSEIDLTQNLDVIWNNMKINSCRKHIKRAEKAGIVIKCNNNFDKFYKIYENHLRYKKYLVLKDSKEVLKKYGTLFTAEIDGEILCGHVFLEDKDNIYSYRSAAKIINDRRMNTLKGNANKLLHWTAINYAKEKGIQKFDLGGFSTESINVFKESFGGKRVSYYNYWKDYSPSYRLTSSFARKLYRLRQFVYKIPIFLASITVSTWGFESPFCTSMFI